MTDLSVDLGHARRLRPDDPLVRALGWKKGIHTVVDATAGLGRDAASLAAMGFSVIAVERSPALADLWRQAMPRALPNLSFIEGDARAVLTDLAATQRAPDAVYLDPMYPPGKRRGAPQQEMLQLRTLVGDDLDVEDLFAVALETALSRVVIKRPKHAPALGTPHHSWVGASTRFDLHLVKGPAGIKAF